MDASARRKKVAEMMKNGLKAPEIAHKLKVNQATIYNDMRINAGKPGYGAKPNGAHAKVRANAPAAKISMSAYTNARKLQAAVRQRVVASGGEIGELEMYATLLTRELLGGGP